MKKYLILALIPFLYACGGGSSHHKGLDYDEAFSKDTRGLDILTGQFANNIDRIWGVNELLVASRKDYVKYTDQYYTRSHISFEDGIITIETLADQAHLKNAIVHTLLMGGDPKGIDLFASGDTPISANPFLAGQVKDQYGRFVTNAVIANDFANYLVQNATTRRLKNGRNVAVVQIKMVEGHIEIRARQYLPLVRKMAKRYGITFLAPQGVSTEGEASAKTVAAIIRQIKQQGVKAVFTENIKDGRMVQRIAQETGAKVGGVLYSDALSKGAPAKTYADMFRYNVKTMAGAMK